MIDIKTFRKENNISQSEICSVLGIKQPYLSSIENGKRPLNKQKFTLLYEQYGDIILKYKTNEHPILCVDELETELHPTVLQYLKDKATNEVNNIDTQEPSAYSVYLLPMSAMGGSLTGFATDGVTLPNCEKIISPIGNVDFAITVHGESMSPKYPSGTRVLIKKINPNIFIDWGKPYVLDTSNGVIIKELRKSNKEGYIACYSINPDPKFAPFDIPLSEVYGIYRVLMSLSAE